MLIIVISQKPNSQVHQQSSRPIAPRAPQPKSPTDQPAQEPNKETGQQPQEPNSPKSPTASFCISASFQRGGQLGGC